MSLNLPVFLMDVAIWHVAFRLTMEVTHHLSIAAISHFSISRFWADIWKQECLLTWNSFKFYSDNSVYSLFWLPLTAHSHLPVLGNGTKRWCSSAESPGSCYCHWIICVTWSSRNEDLWPFTWYIFSEWNYNNKVLQWLKLCKFETNTRKEEKK